MVHVTMFCTREIRTEAFCMELISKKSFLHTQNPTPLLWVRVLACIFRSNIFLYLSTPSSDVWWYFTVQLITRITSVLSIGCRCFLFLVVSRVNEHASVAKQRWKAAGETVKAYRLRWSFVAVVTLRASWRLHDLGAMTWDLGPGS